MLRQMRSRYNSRCRRCGSGIRRGDSIYWSKPTGALCVSCGSKKQPGETKSSAEAPKINLKSESTKKVHGLAEWMIDWSDLKQFTSDVFKSNKVPSDFQQTNQRTLDYYLVNLPQSFCGYSRGQVERWLKAGYQSDAIQGIAEFIPPIRDKRKLQFTDEGDEFHLDMAYGGMDNYMSEWTKREVIPGIRLDFVLWFVSSTPAKVVNDFNRWMSQVIYAIEASGVDPEINLAHPGYFSPGGSGFYNVIRVKKEGETTDFLSISPMLSPAAYRTFSFTAIVLQGQATGHAVDIGISSRVDSINNDWKVEYDPEKRRISVFSHPTPREFPAERLTAELREVLKEIKG